PTSPGPCVTPIASTSANFIPACSSASRTTGTICRRCSREANSGTTPPYFRCTSICDATTLDRISRPSATTAAAVSSQEDSIPRIRRLAIGCRARTAKKMLAHAPQTLAAWCRHSTSAGRRQATTSLPPFESFPTGFRVFSKLLGLTNLVRRGYCADSDDFDFHGFWIPPTSMPPNGSPCSSNFAPIRKVRKAVLPAAGLGTRFLPATKAQPKEMLTVVDKPQIQYVVEECVASGIEHVIIVTGKGKNSIEDHFDSSPMLESFLESKGKMEQAELIRDISNMVQVSYTRQKE